MEKVWKTIDGYSNYEVSNFGEVRNKKSKYLLKQRMYKGHVAVQIYNDHGNASPMYVSSLVLRAFGDCEDRLRCSIRHIDNNPKNNHIENLCYTQDISNNRVYILKKENISHQFRLLKNAAIFLGIDSENKQYSYQEIKEAAHQKGFKIWDREDRSKEESTYTPYNSSEDTGKVSSPEVKKQIRNKIDEFVKYCDTHYSTCNEIERKGSISIIDEGDPVVIEFRAFMKEHKM